MGEDRNLKLKLKNKGFSYSFQKTATFKETHTQIVVSYADTPLGKQAICQQPQQFIFLLLP